MNLGGGEEDDCDDDNGSGGSISSWTENAFHNIGSGGSGSGESGPGVGNGSEDDDDAEDDDEDDGSGESYSGAGDGSEDDDGDASRQDNNNAVDNNQNNIHVVDGQMIFRTPHFNFPLYQGTRAHVFSTPRRMHSYPAEILDVDANGLLIRVLFDDGHVSVREHVVPASRIDEVMEDTIQRRTRQRR